MTLTDDDLRNIPSPGDDFDITNGKLLAPILIPRVPGTDGQLIAQKHFVDFFAESLPDWTVEWQNFTDKTPVTGNKDIPFSNIIFRRDPPDVNPGDVSRLTLVAHYDSKIDPPGFIGAIDSAAPCAMLMHLARSIDKALTSKWEEEEGLNEPKGVQILFLDGEEAFHQWTSTDSLYGARALAEQWDNQFHASMSTFRTPLDSISLFVLLDLLGSVDPQVPSYFLTTHWAYRAMASIESRMRKLGILETKPANSFLPDSDKASYRFGSTFVDDDHRPFMERGVDVLHLIPSPFPKVWHRIEDDGEHLDLATCRDWAKIATAFVVEWMDIQDHMPKLSSTKIKRAEAAQLTASMRTEL
ncbi:hypothetical protein BGZ63DRAFT_410502 [Mariannaea sp. PMI_226]|nr:hypothetical protein BGZ63DRAFT_410502 [Mariannaea sp. PMI_226]